MRINFEYSTAYDEMLTRMYNLDYDGYQEIELKEYINRLNSFWRRVGKKIVKEIEKVSKLKFRRNINCFIVKNMVFEAFSHPFTLRVNENFEELKSVMIHELIHILMVDNSKKIWNLLNRKYENEDMNFRVHLPVLLIEKKVIENLFGENYFRKVLKEEKHFDDLKEIWQKVEKISFHNNIVKFLKK